MRMLVAGQFEGIVQYEMHVDVSGPYVSIKLEGPDGCSYGTLTPDQADALAGELARVAKLARSRSGLELAPS